RWRGNRFCDPAPDGICHLPDASLIVLKSPEWVHDVGCSGCWWAKIAEKVCERFANLPKRHCFAFPALMTSEHQEDQERLVRGATSTQRGLSKPGESFQDDLKAGRVVGHATRLRRPGVSQWGLPDAPPKISMRAGRLSVWFGFWHHPL